MIRASKGPNNTCIAVCRCDICATETSFSAIHNDIGGTSFSARALTLKSPGHVTKRLLAMGWTIISKKLRCPDCEAARKNFTKPKDPKMTTATELRNPTREQIREIIQALEITYDAKAGRYTAGETDATVAKSMGGGIMPGWVAAERERAFGPVGGNEELDAVLEELVGYRARVKTVESLAVGEIHGIDSAIKRIEAIKKAVGPKAVNA